MNKIGEARKYFDEFFRDKEVELEGMESEFSPSGNYELKIRSYGWRGVNAYADFAKVEIWSVAKQEKLLEVNSEDTFWHCWIEKHAKEYLVYGENRGGQTVIEFPDVRHESYFVSHNDFIWTEFHPSPDKQKIAIFGCHWGGPWEIVVYDFSFPMNLPLPIITRENLDEAHEDFGKWLSNSSFSLVAHNKTTRTITLNHTSSKSKQV